MNLKKEILHYALLTVFLFIGFYVGEVYLNISSSKLWTMFLFWFLVLFVADKITHKILGIK
jgi:hypothetical protein